MSMKVEFEKESMMKNPSKKPAQMKVEILHDVDGEIERESQRGKAVVCFVLQDDDRLNISTQGNFVDVARLVLSLGEATKPLVETVTRRIDEMASRKK